MTPYQIQFWQNLQNHRGEIAIIDNNKIIDYGQLEKYILYLNSKYDRHNHIAFWASRSFESTVFMLFCIMTGRKFTPISIDTPKKNVALFCQQLKSPDVIDPKLILREINIDSFKCPRLPCVLTDFNVSDLQQPQYVLFTSGSTGTPKGVPISFENLTAYWRCARSIIRAGKQDVFSQAFDHSFDLAIHDVLLASTSFATLVILSKDDLKDPVQSIKNHNITIWFSVPSIIPLFRKPINDNDLSTLRLAMFCGEKFYTEHAQHLRSMCHATIQNWYGPTEATIACSHYVYNGHETEDTLPIGLPFDGTRFDFDNVKETRELLIGGAQLFKGYTAQQSEIFINRGDIRYYKSGDVISIRDEKIFIVGRNNAMVKWNGYRIDLNEIENAASKVAGDVNLAAIVSQSDDAIYLVVETDDDLLTDTIFADLKELLPKYAIPKQIITVPSFPRTISGKVDRKTLQASLPVTNNNRNARENILSVIDKNKKLMHLGLDSIELMQVYLELEVQNNIVLRFEHIENFLELSVNEIIQNVQIDNPIETRPQRFLSLNDVFLNSRFRRYSSIYHKWQKLINPEIEFVAIGTSGLYRALGCYEEANSNILNLCMPGMSLEAIAKLSKVLKLKPLNKMKAILEIDPVMLTKYRPRGDREIGRKKVPKPPIVFLQSGEYDFDPATNGFAKEQQTTGKVKEMRWVTEREQIIKKCYVEHKIWEDRQIAFVRETYEKLKELFSDVYIYVQPLKSVLIDENIRKPLRDIVLPPDKYPEVVFLKIDQSEYNDTNYFDINHFNATGSVIFKRGLIS